MFPAPSFLNTTASLHSNSVVRLLGNTSPLKENPKTLVLHLELAQHLHRLHRRCPGMSTIHITTN